METSITITSGIQIPTCSRSSQSENGQQKRMSACVLEELNLFDFLYRFQRYRRLQIETHSRSDMDFNSSLLHLHADVGWR